MGEMTYEERRFGETLDAPLAGDALDQREDPELVALVNFTRGLAATAAELRPREGFARRSRSILLHSMETRRPAHSPARRWRARLLQSVMLAPAAAAAAAAAAAVFVFAGGSTGGAATVQAPAPIATTPAAPAAPAASVQNLTPLNIDQEIMLLRSAADAATASATSGQALPAGVLRVLADGSARVAHAIKSEPGSVSPNGIVTYITAAADVRSALANVEASPGNEAVLAAARASAQDGVVVASRYFLDVSTVPDGSVTPDAADPAAGGNPLP